MTLCIEKFNLSGEIALITGAAQGTGLACAQTLGEAGALVVLADLSLPRLDAAVAHLAEFGIKAERAELDVSDSAAVERVAGEVSSFYGSPTILVNNTGIGRSGQPAEVISDALWHDHIRVNLDGVFFCCRNFGRRMLAGSRGTIVNIGSMSGEIVNMPQQQAFYNASKAAVHHLTRSLAAEWARRGVRVNAVAPTYINMPLTSKAMEDSATRAQWLGMTPMNRVGRMNEIASVVLFLAQRRVHSHDRLDRHGGWRLHVLVMAIS
jgi:NAD(P)-dependent dehydrogenase (short-subunit alcohol dehydrogenase family)